MAPDGNIRALVSAGTYGRGPLWDAITPVWDACNDADDRCRATIAAIRVTAAEGLAGVAIKVLAQLPNGDMEDVIESRDTVRGDIARLIDLTIPELS